MASLASLLNPVADAERVPSSPDASQYGSAHANLPASPPNAQWTSGSPRDSAQPAGGQDHVKQRALPPLEHSCIASSSPSDIALQSIADSQSENRNSISSVATQLASIARRPPASTGAIFAAQSAVEATPLSNTFLSHSSDGSRRARTSCSAMDEAMMEEPRLTAEGVAHAQKAVAALKSEHSQQHAKSPLRESSVPVPSTEDQVKEEALAAPKKRPAPTKKKGTASTVKKEKAPPAKKRKVEAKRAETPSSRPSKTATGKIASAKGTPVNSSPAPSARSYSAEPQDDDDDEDGDVDDDGRSQDGDLYCICRKPDRGEFMIGCDGTCDDWFHGKCVGVVERDKNLIDKYICPACTEAGVGRTTWKRICRRTGCRNPAKASKSKSGNHTSKYCSEECGVLYFREMAMKSRGADESAGRRAARRKGSLDNASKQDDDLGARGGALAAGEVRALLDVSSTIEDFRRLGDGVLSPPATPDGDGGKDVLEYTEAEARDLNRIEAEKEHARHRHALLKDRMKFVTMAKQVATRVATEKGLKPKEYCGYDPRIEWNEEQFQAWRNSKAGREAFEADVLVSTQPKGADGPAEAEALVPEVCDRKKCARHLEWSKLAVDDLRFEMSDNGDRMRSLDREEQDIKQRAALRSKTAGPDKGGTVELHGAAAIEALAHPDEQAADESRKTAAHLEIVPTVERVDEMEIDAA